MTLALGCPRYRRNDLIKTSRIPAPADHPVHRKRSIGAGRVANTASLAHAIPVISLSGRGIFSSFSLRKRCKASAVRVSVFLI